MKSTLAIIITVVVLGVLAFTNPKLENYDEFINQKIIEESSKHEDPMAGMLGALFGGMAADLMAKQTVRKDYVIFSTYDTPMGKEHIRAIGIFNRFFLTEGL